VKGRHSHPLPSKSIGKEMKPTSLSHLISADTRGGEVGARHVTTTVLLS